MTPDEMKARTKSFALRIIRLCEALPRTPAAQVIRGQLLRSGTSVGANYRAACRSRSAAEFVARLGVAQEEADESSYWIELLVETKVIALPRLKPLLNEAEELCRIFTQSRKTAARKVKRPATQSKTENRKSKIHGGQP